VTFRPLGPLACESHARHTSRGRVARAGWPEGSIRVNQFATRTVPCKFSSGEHGSVDMNDWEDVPSHIRCRNAVLGWRHVQPARSLACRHDSGPALAWRQWCYRCSTADSRRRRFRISHHISASTAGGGRARSWSCSLSVSLTASGHIRCHRPLGLCRTTVFWPNGDRLVDNNQAPGWHNGTVGSEHHLHLRVARSCAWSARFGERTLRVHHNYHKTKIPGLHECDHNA
jgi:hypothetical protein